MYRSLMRSARREEKIPTWIATQTTAEVDTATNARSAGVVTISFRQAAPAYRISALNGISPTTIASAPK